jgi:hypothetical protein
MDIEKLLGHTCNLVVATQTQRIQGKREFLCRYKIRFFIWVHLFSVKKIISDLKYRNAGCL